MPHVVIRIPKSELPILEKSSKFLQLLRLMRFQNQILFLARSFLDYADVDSTVGQRQRFNAQWFLCGVMFEAVKFIPELGKEFRHFTSFKAGFASYLREKETQRLRDLLLRRMRNSAVFHIDEKLFMERFRDYGKDYALPWCDLSVASNAQLLDKHFVLADEIVLNYFAGANDTDETMWAVAERVENDLEKIAKLAFDFLEHGNDLVHEYAKRKGWSVKHVDSDPGRSVRRDAS